MGEEMTRGCVLTTFLFYDGRLHREKRKTEREKSFCMFYITCGPTTQREENFFFREKFLNFIIIKFCSKVFFVVFVSAAVY